jgi:hypothetical protein
LAQKDKLIKTATHSIWEQLLTWKREASHIWCCVIVVFAIFTQRTINMLMPLKTSLTFSRLITSARSGAVRFIHETPSKQDASVTTEATQEEKSFGQTLAHRFTVTFEVAVSKLFPAGMGWQAFSTFASDMGLQANEMGFFAMTGTGRGLMCL